MADKKPQMGSVDIKLTTPIKIAGADVSALRMREPTLDDQIVFEKLTGTEAERDKMTLAHLCQVAPEDLGQLTLRDYNKAKVAFLGFLG